MKLCILLHWNNIPAIISRTLKISLHAMKLQISIFSGTLYLNFYSIYLMLNSYLQRACLQNSQNWVFVSYKKYIIVNLHISLLEF